MEYAAEGRIIEARAPNKCRVLVNVDDDVYEKIQVLTWGVDSKGYVRHTWRASGKSYSMPLHIFVMGKIKDKVIDHISRNKLDNRRSNLRHVTPTINVVNRGPNTGKLFKGITYLAKVEKWQVSININKKRVYIGLFKSEIEAALAYDHEVIKLYGTQVFLNFPELARLSAAQVCR